jgi:hypothetical protein
VRPRADGFLPPPVTRRALREGAAQDGGLAGLRRRPSLESRQVVGAMILAALPAVEVELARRSG